MVACMFWIFVLWLVTWWEVCS